jgi:hypothetical protein
MVGELVLTSTSIALSRPKKIRCKPIATTRVTNRPKLASIYFAVVELSWSQRRDRCADPADDRGDDDRAQRASSPSPSSIWISIRLNELGY